jgi:hypothetical protein
MTLVSQLLLCLLLLHGAWAQTGGVRALRSLHVQLFRFFDSCAWLLADLQLVMQLLPVAARCACIPSADLLSCCLFSHGFMQMLKHSSTFASKTTSQSVGSSGTSQSMKHQTAQSATAAATQLRS